jgi:hypothetical protein
MVTVGAVGNLQRFRKKTGTGLLRAMVDNLASVRNGFACVAVVWHPTDIRRDFDAGRMRARRLPGSPVCYGFRFRVEDVDRFGGCVRGKKPIDTRAVRFRDGIAGDSHG